MTVIECGMKRHSENEEARFVMQIIKNGGEWSIKITVAIVYRLDGKGQGFPQGRQLGQMWGKYRCLLSDCCGNGKETFPKDIIDKKNWSTQSFGCEKKQGVKTSHLQGCCVDLCWNCP